MSDLYSSVAAYTSEPTAEALVYCVPLSIAKSKYGLALA